MTRSWLVSVAPYDEPGYGIVQECPVFVPKRGQVPVSRRFQICGS